jgi:hypothetical protein
VPVLFAAPALSVHQAFAQLGESVAGPVLPQGMIYQPILLFQGEARCVSRRYNLDFAIKRACLVSSANGAAGARIEWDAAVREPIDPGALDAQPIPGARFGAIPAWLANPKTFSAAQKDFADWLYRKGTLRIYANETLKISSAPEDTQSSFRQQCAEIARQGLKAENDKIEAAFALKLNGLTRKMDRQEAIVGKYENEVDRRRMEEMGTNFELFFSIFSRRKRSLSNALSKGRLTSSARAELEAADQALDSLQDESKDLEAQKNAALKEAQERWARAVGAIDEVPLTPLRKDIYVEVAALVWAPFYLLQAEGRTLQAIAF